MFVAGWRHALQSEWPFVIIFITLLLLASQLTLLLLASQLTLLFLRPFLTSRCTYSDFSRATIYIPTITLRVLLGVPMGAWILSFACSLLVGGCRFLE